MLIQSTKLFPKTNFGMTNSTDNKPEQLQKDNKNKKTAAIVGGLAALAFAGTVAAVAIKRHKTPSGIKSILDNYKVTNETANTLIESAQKQADEATEYAQKLFDEVTELFKKGDEIAPDGTVLRKITGDDTEKIMEEFTQDGKLYRKSTFFVDILESVEDGIEELADGSRKIAKRIGFKDEMPSWYQEGYKEFDDGLYSIAKEIDFEYGKPWRYQGGIEELADGSRKIAKRIGFEDEMPSWYQEGYEKLADGSWKVAKRIGFKDEMPSWYQEGYKEFDDGLYSIAKEIDFEDGKPSLYQEGYKELADGSSKIAREYRLTKKGWQEVSK